MPGWTTLSEDDPQGWSKLSVTAAASGGGTVTNFVPALRTRQYTNDYANHVGGTFGTWNWANTSSAFGSAAANGFVPANFATLVSLKVLLITSASVTIEYDVNVNYGAATEAYNTHTGALVNQTLATTAGVMYAVDVSSAVASLAANDYLGVEVGDSGGANTANVALVGLLLQYTIS